MTETEIFDRYGVPHVDALGVKVGKDDASQSYGVRFEIGADHGFLHLGDASSMAEDLIVAGAVSLAEAIYSMVIRARDDQAASPG